MSYTVDVLGVIDERVLWLLESGALLPSSPSPSNVVGPPLAVRVLHHRQSAPGGRAAAETGASLQFDVACGSDCQVRETRRWRVTGPAGRRLCWRVGVSFHRRGLRLLRI